MNTFPLKKTNNKKQKVAALKLLQKRPNLKLKKSMNVGSHPGWREILLRKSNWLFFSLFKDASPLIQEMASVLISLWESQRYELSWFTDCY